MISSTATPQEIRARNLRNVALVSLIIEISVVILSGYLGFTQSPLLFVSGSAFALACGLTILAIRLAKNGNPTAGAWCLIAGFGLGAIMAATILSDIGPMTGMVILLFIFLITIQTLPHEHARWGFLAGSVLSVVTGLLVFFPPFPPVSLTGATTSGVVLWAGRAAVIVMILVILLQYRTLSLNNKILAAFLGIVVIIILAITAVVEIRTSNTTTTQIGRELGGIAQARGAVLGDYLDSQVEYLRTLALDETMRREIAASNAAYTGNDAVDLSNLTAQDEQWRQAVQNNETDAFMSRRLTSLLAYRLRAFQELHPSHIEMFVTDEKGALVAATNRTSDYYQGDETWWQESRYNNGQVYISSPEYDESTGRISVLISVPVYDPESDALLGILRTTLDLDAVAAVIQAPIGETGDTDIFFPEIGQILHGTTLEETQPGFLEAIQIVSSKSYNAMEYDGIESIVAAAEMTTTTDQPAVEGLGWFAIVHQSRSEALAPVQTQVSTLSFFGTIMLGVAALLSVIVSQPLARPILDLTRIADEVSKGNLSARARIDTRDEIGALAETFNGMTAQLQDTLAGLEQRVSERTAALESSSHQLQRRSGQLQAIAEVSQTIASIQDINVLLPEVARLVSERFGYYHAGIFLLDEKGEYAVLRAANSEGGQKMLARKHRLRIGQEGVVGFSISQRYPHIALDVGEDAVFFQNPDLPNTHSEISLPLIIGDRVIGALDVQSEQTGAFTAEDSEVFTTLANQVAVAIENARLFAESRQALSELDKTFQRYIQGEWQKLSTTANLEGYLANAEGLAPIARSQKQTSRSKASTYKVPIRLRGITIGTIDIQTDKKPEEYSEDEIAIAQAAAERVALALENARLIEQSQRRATKERTIGEIASKIGSLVDIDNILQTAAQEMGRIIPGAEVTIQMQGEE